MKKILGGIAGLALILGLESQTLAGVDQKQMAQNMTKIIEHLEWSEKCEQFVAPNSLGPWGQAVLSYTNRAAYPNLYKGTRDMQLVCPSYQQLRDEEKDYVLLMLVTAMSFYESSCQPKANAKGPNGTVYGLLQLHLNRENIYADECNRGDSKTPARNLMCGLAMLDEQILRDEKLFSNKSYWDVLRPSSPSKRANKIAWSLMLLPQCQWKAPMKTAKK